MFLKYMPKATHRAPAFSYKFMSKYHNQKTTVKGRTFDSKKEAERFLVLFERLNKGEIEKLATQVSFVLIPSYTNAKGEKVKPLKYIADFCYYENGRFIIEDVKGYRTEVYKIKKKLFEYKYKDEGLTITEI